MDCSRELIVSTVSLSISSWPLIYVPDDQGVWAQAGNMQRGGERGTSLTAGMCQFVSGQGNH